jgi:hypothetical protein
MKEENNNSLESFFYEEAGKVAGFLAGIPRGIYKSVTIPSTIFNASEFLPFKDSSYIPEEDNSFERFRRGFSTTWNIVSDLTRWGFFGAMIADWCDGKPELAGYLAIPFVVNLGYNLFKKIKGK